MNDWIGQEWQRFTDQRSPDVESMAPIDPARPRIPHWPRTDSIEHTGVSVERMAGHADYICKD